MKAPFAESRRGLSVRLEIAEVGDVADLVVRRTTSSASDATDLEETFILRPGGDLARFWEWATSYCKGDGTLRSFRLGQESDIVHGIKLGKKKILLGR